MKLYERLLIALGVLALAVLGLTGQARAQASGVQPIWSNYNVQYVNVFYNPLAGSTLIPASTIHRARGNGRSTTCARLSSARRIETSRLEPGAADGS